MAKIRGRKFVVYGEEYNATTLAAETEHSWWIKLLKLISKTTTGDRHAYEWYLKRGIK